jgi:hypothetical protein
MQQAGPQLTPLPGGHERVPLSIATWPEHWKSMPSISFFRFALVPAVKMQPFKAYSNSPT